MNCVRCAKREPSPGYDLCRACRYYRRGPYGTSAMVVIGVRFPPATLERLRADAAAAGVTLSELVRGHVEAALA